LESALAFIAIGSEKLFLYDEAIGAFTRTSDFEKNLEAFCHFSKTLTFSRVTVQGVFSLLNILAEYFLVKNKSLPFLRKQLGHPFGKESAAILRRMEEIKKVSTPLFPVLEKTLRDFEHRELLPKPLLTGKDLIHEGWTPGSHFQETLEKAYDWQLAETTLTQETVLKRLEKNKK
jgi:hypothetical protein